LNSQKPTDFLNNQNLLVLMFKWRKPLVIVSITAFIVSIIASLLMTNIYKSTVTLFPNNTSSFTTPLIGGNPLREDILKFGEKEEAEQLLQILKSDQIRNKTIKSLNLIEYYNIDTLQSKWKADLIEIFQGNVTFNITKFAAIEIEVLDKSPEMAAKIANEITNLIDTVKNNIRYETNLQSLKLVTLEYEKTKKEMKFHEDSLNFFRNLGMNDYESQVERITEQLSIAILNNNSKGKEELEKRLAIFSKHGNEFLFLRDKIYYLQKHLANLDLKINELELELNNKIPSNFVIDYATPADKKHSPKRMIIVLISVMSAFLLTFVFLLIKDSISNLTALKQD